MGRDYIKVIITGVGFGLSAIVLAALIFAGIISGSDISRSAAATMATAALTLGSLIAGFVASRLHRKNGMLVGLFTGSVLFALVFVSNLILVPGGGFAIIPIKLAVILIASMLGGVTGVNFGVRGRR